jgi:adenylate kinase family enzyme
MQRVAVIGVTGTGKSTLAASLATKLNLEHVELDALHWGPGWTEADTQTFRNRVDAVTRCERWVVDGNYAKVRDLVWTRADHIVWLDYSLAVTLGRLFVRTMRRIRTQETLWNGNRERFAEQFLSRQSLFLWALHSHPKYRTTYPALLADDACRHATIVRLRSPRETHAWLDEIEVARQSAFN